MSFVGLLAFTFTLAQTTKESAVTMVSYDQSWTDYNATVALKNNTNEEIENVEFRIIYFDTSGTQLDYKDFVKSVTIAPGLTKQIHIDAFNHDRHSHYYKSEDSPVGSQAFDVKFELLDYNKPISLSVSDPDVPGLIGAGAILLFLLIMLVVGILLLVLVAKMARKRNRNVPLWVILSVFISPIPVIIILLIIGDDNNTPVL